MSKTIVITGAGAGLGRAMARRLARDGHRLVLLGRTLAKVEAVAEEIGGEPGRRPATSPMPKASKSPSPRSLRAKLGST